MYSEAAINIAAMHNKIHNSCHSALSYNSLLVTPSPGLSAGYILG